MHSSATNQHELFCGACADTNPANATTGARTEECFLRLCRVWMETRHVGNAVLPQKKSSFPVPHIGPYVWNELPLVLRAAWFRASTRNRFICSNLHSSSSFVTTVKLCARVTALASRAHGRYGATEHEGWSEKDAHEPPLVVDCERYSCMCSTTRVCVRADRFDVQL